MNRAELVEAKHRELSIRRQCELLHVRRSVFYYKSMETSESERRIMRALDEVYMIDPCMGSRRLVVKLREGYGLETHRKQVQRLRREMGIETIWCRPRRTSLPDNGHRKYPYLLKGRNISEADEVWCSATHGRGAVGWEVTRAALSCGVVLWQCEVGDRQSKPEQHW